MKNGGGFGFAAVSATALLQTGLCLTAEAYEDLTVEVGEELTISTNSFYNSITVNGTLTLDSKAVVKVENATGGGVVKVGSGAGVTGTLNVKDGANLTANNKSGADVTLPLTFVWARSPRRPSRAGPSSSTASSSPTGASGSTERSSP